MTEHRIASRGLKVPGGHWTRSLLPGSDGKKLYAGVGSQSNIAEMGMEVEEGRAAIYELDLASVQRFARKEACKRLLRGPTIKPDERAYE